MYNIWALAAAQEKNGYKSSQWGTFKAAMAKGGKVKKGEKGTMILFYQWKTKKATKDSEETIEQIPLFRVYFVFNRDQIEGLPPETTFEHEPRSSCEEMIKLYLANGPKFVSDLRHPCYVPSEDTVHMPRRNKFHSANAYYSAFFHELTHSTGHASRLNRSSVYKYVHEISVRSREELIAELGSVLLLGKCGLEFQENHQQYINEWASFLREKPREVLQAFAQAEKARDYIINCKTSEKAINHVA